MVIGTVLDPEMQDDVRVTVVATGLNRGVQAQRIPSRDFHREPVRGAEREAARPKVQLIRNATTGLAEYGEAPAPAGREPSFGALRSRSADVAPVTALSDLPADQSYLDIPAFLRRQAD